MTLNTCLPRTLKAMVEEGLLSGQPRKPGHFQTLLCSITNLILTSNARQKLIIIKTLWLGICLHIFLVKAKDVLWKTAPFNNFQRCWRYVNSCLVFYRRCTGLFTTWVFYRRCTGPFTTWVFYSWCTGPFRDTVLYRWCTDPFRDTGVLQTVHRSS